MSEYESDRRKNQRIQTTQESAKPFWLIHGQHKIRLRDLSMNGFSFVDDWQPALGAAFDFVVVHEGEDNQISGSARVSLTLPISGCEITHIGEADRAQLQAWLSQHVMACANIPISEHEADMIVTGPSIV